MSALGQKLTYAVHNSMSALPPKAISNATYGNVRFGPMTDIVLGDAFFCHVQRRVPTIRAGSRTEGRSMIMCALGGGISLARTLLDHCENECRKETHGENGGEDICNS